MHSPLVFALLLIQKSYTERVRMVTYRCICGGEVRNCSKCGGTGVLSGPPIRVSRSSRNFAQAALENPFLSPVRIGVVPTRRISRDSSLKDIEIIANVNRQLPAAIEQFQRSGCTNFSPFARHIRLLTFCFAAGHSFSLCPMNKKGFYAYPDEVDSWAETAKSESSKISRQRLAVEVRRLVILAQSLYNESIR